RAEARLERIREAGRSARPARCARRGSRAAPALGVCRPSRAQGSNPSGDGKVGERPGCRGGRVMTVVTLKRLFRTGSTELQDPDPTLTPDEVRQHWAVNYPHLATATVSEPEQKGDNLIYVFEAPQAKTKGAD